LPRREIGIDDVEARRSPDRRHRSSPLRGLWTHCNGGYHHDGRFATLDDVVAYYDARFGLQPDAQDRRDLVECLKSL